MKVNLCDESDVLRRMNTKSILLNKTNNGDDFSNQEFTLGFSFFE
jgi:hypothetical protein